MANWQLAAMAILALLWPGTARCQLVQPSPQLKAAIASGNHPQIAQIALREMLACERQYASRPTVCTDLQLYAANSLAASGAIDAAERIARKTVAMHSVPGGDPRQLGTALIVLGNVLEAGQRYLEAEAVLRRTAALFNTPATPLESAIAQHNLAINLMRQGRYREADPLIRDAINTLDRARNAPATTRLRFMSTLASSLERQQRLNEAARVLVALTSEEQRVLGSRHFQLGLDLYKLAQIYLSQKKFAAVLPLAMRAHLILSESRGPGDGDTLLAVSAIAAAAAELGQVDDAIRYYRLAVAGLSRRYGTSHHSVGSARAGLAKALVLAGRTQEAEAVLQQAMPAFAALRPDHPMRLDAEQSLAMTLRHNARFPEARTAFRRAAAGIALRIRSYREFDAAARQELRERRFVFTGLVGTDWTLSRPR
ncbi:tetratricopeptide repeat protein [Sphingomonas sp.]|uniref:tetratricopeptide repeat protein n=1 Tax=Sphingomonas sp. TaxID=28214 RepID=UPI001EC2D9F4|nr:tetratricopeptide repeat protein [Sphingomonas sp.]MBX3593675.1 tetratricopeptide repeat protein [Sphingomonas sp.]